MSSNCHQYVSRGAEKCQSGVRSRSRAPTRNSNALRLIKLQQQRTAGHRQVSQSNGVTPVIRSNRPVVNPFRQQATRPVVNRPTRSVVNRQAVNRPTRSVVNRQASRPVTSDNKTSNVEPEVSHKGNHMVCSNEKKRMARLIFSDKNDVLTGNSHRASCRSDGSRMTLCRNFMNGYCRFGSKCKFSHVKPEVVAEPEHKKAKWVKVFDSSSENFPPLGNVQVHVDEVKGETWKDLASDLLDEDFSNVIETKPVFRKIKVKSCGYTCNNCRHEKCNGCYGCKCACHCFMVHFDDEHEDYDDIYDQCDFCDNYKIVTEVKGYANEDVLGVGVGPSIDCICNKCIATHFPGHKHNQSVNILSNIF